MMFRSTSMYWKKGMKLLKKKKKKGERRFLLPSCFVPYFEGELKHALSGFKLYIMFHKGFAKMVIIWKQLKILLLELNFKSRSVRTGKIWIDVSLESGNVEANEIWTTEGQGNSKHENIGISCSWFLRWKPTPHDFGKQFKAVFLSLCNVLLHWQQLSLKLKWD